MKHKYSRVYNYDYGQHHNKFRYNFEEKQLELVCKPSEEMLEDAREDAENCSIGWMKAEAKANLISYEETGYIVIDSSGLREDSWKEDRYYYMDVMSEDLACLVGW